MGPLGARIKYKEYTGWEMCLEYNKQRNQGYMEAFLGYHRASVPVTTLRCLQCVK